MPVQLSERANVLLLQSLDKHFLQVLIQFLRGQGGHTMAANLDTYCSVYHFPKEANLVNGKKQSPKGLKGLKSHNYRALYLSLHLVWGVVNDAVRDAWYLKRRITLFYYNNIIHSSYSASCPNKCFFHSSFAIISEGNSERFMEGKCYVIKWKETDGHPWPEQ